MKLILLSGGSGKRLWPLSNDTRSKQFLKVLENPNGVMESMIQRVWRQITSVNLEKSTVIATSHSQVDMIRNQLGHTIPLVVEPERRDTFPAIALAVTYLYSVQNASLDEVVVISPVDPYVEEDFFEKTKELENTIHFTGADLALIGVEPTYPSEKYGYIVPKREENSAAHINVNNFREKPNKEQAEQLLEQDALWNCGVFAFKLEYLLKLLIGKGLPTDYEELLNNYQSLPKISFDYEVVENAKDIVALPYYGSWKDLGTWNTLTEEMKNNVIGRGIISSDSKHTHLVNELEIPIAIMGLSDVIVASSPDGILVSKKEASPRIKELIGEFSRRPMYEERRWGWYKVLDHAKYENQEVLTKKICIKKDQNLSYQLHYKRSEVWTIVKGDGMFILDGEISYVKAGDVLQISAEKKHAIKAISDLEIIEVQTGSELVEADIVRIVNEWEEILKLSDNNLIKN